MENVNKAMIVQVIQVVNDTADPNVKVAEFWSLDGQRIGELTVDLTKTTIAS